MPKLTVNDIELNVVDRGHGHPVLFVHGFPLNHTMWQAQLDRLAERFRVLAPDLRGFGESGVTEGTVGMPQFADDLDGLLEALGIAEPVSLCGLSMGGYIAWAFVRRYPQRLRSLILCDTKAAPDTPEGAEGRLQTARDVLENGPETLAESMPAKLFAESTLQHQPQLVEQVRQMILTTDPRGIAAALRGMAERPDSTELLPGIRVPTLMLAGIEDRLTTPEEMRSMAEATPEAEFVEVPDAGHMAPLENPSFVNDALARFLAAAAA